MSSYEEKFNELYKNDKNLFPLSIEQESLWIDSSLLEDDAKDMLLEATSFVIEGDITLNDIQNIYYAILRRHPALRTRFEVIDDIVVQRIMDGDTISPSNYGTYEDISNIDETHRAEYIEKTFSNRIDIEDKIADFTLFKLDHKKFLCVVYFHHLVVDYMSFIVCINDFFDLVNLLDKNELDPYVVEEYDRSKELVFQKRISYKNNSDAQKIWQKKLSDEFEIIQIPQDRNHPQTKSGKGGLIVSIIENSDFIKIKELAKKNSATPFVILNTIFSLLLHKLSNSNRITLLTAFDIRDKYVQHEMGYFINSLPIIVDIDDNMSLSSIFACMKAEVRAVSKMRTYPSSEVNKYFSYDRTLPFHPMQRFKTTYTSYRPLNIKYDNYNVSYKPFRTQSNGGSDFAVVFVDNTDEISCEFNYDKDIFDEATVDSMVKRFNQILNQILEDDAKLIKDITPLFDEEIVEQTKKLNQIEKVFDQKNTIHKLFESKVLEFPDNIAVSCEDTKLSYKELNEKANQLSDYLLSIKIIKKDDLVAVCLERSAEMIISILAILKSGAAYVPIDDTYPQDRIDYILEDSKTDILITQKSLTNKFKSFSKNLLVLDDINLDKYSKENKNIDVKPNNLVYVIYTSGTTGRPKGVMLEHHNVDRLFKSSREIYDFNENDVWTMFHSFAFDFTVWEIWGPLLHGAKLVVVPYLVSRSSSEFYKLLKDEKVTILNQTPSAFNQVIQEDQKSQDKLTSLKYVIFGGEKLDFISLKPWIEKYSYTNPYLINMYGITETAVFTTYNFLDKDDIKSQKSLIGESLLDLACYILDKNLNLMPKGVPGELYIEGDGLARGYLNQEELTSQRFIDNPFKDDKKLYKSGDLVAYTQDGNIEYLGRLDDQVQIRGFRIELGEIEQQLLQIDGVKEGVVLAKKDSSNYDILVAYLSLNYEISLDQIKNELGKNIPAYMIPNYFMFLEKFPLTSNGKVDKRALASLDIEISSTKKYIAPRDDIEKSVVKIFTTILGVEKIGIEDDFFDLGGHSLLATQMVAKIKETIGMQIPLSTLFSNSKVKSLSRYISNNKGNIEEIDDTLIELVSSKENQNEPFSLNLIQQAYYLGRSSYMTLGNTDCFTYIEIDSDSIDIDCLDKAWNNVIKRHGMLRAIIHDDFTQEVLQEVTRYNILKKDISNYSDNEISNYLAKQREIKLTQKNDPSSWPLVTLDAYKLPKNKVKIYLFIDALVCDATSIMVLLRDLKKYYENKEKILPSLNLEFKDYLAYEKNFIHSNAYKKSFEYWKPRLVSLPAGPALPLRVKPEDIEKPEFIDIKTVFSIDKWKILQEKSAKMQITPTVLLLNFYAKVLSVYSNSKHFTLTLTLNNRLQVHKDIENVFGEFTSLVLLEIDLDKENLFQSLKSIQKQLLDDLDHKDVDGVQLLREMRSIGNDNTMNVAFTSTLGMEGDIDNSWLGETTYQLSQTPQVWLVNDINIENKELVIRWSVLEELFEKELLDDMYSSYIGLIEKFIEDDTLLEDKNISLLTQKQLDKRELYNNTKKELDKTNIALKVMQNLSKYKDSEALVTSKHRLTYQELHNGSSQIANFIKDKGVVANEHIAIILDKSVEQILSVMGCAYSGVAYLPIASDQPIQRIKLLLDESKAKFIFCNDEVKRKFKDEIEGCELVDVATLINLKKDMPNIDITTKDSDLAYTIFTSGSTGKPKGVMISYSNVQNTIADINERFNINKDDKIFGISALNFDLSVYDIYGAFTSGATLVLPDEDERKNPQAWLEWVSKEKITFWNSVPAIVKLLVDEEKTNSLDITSLRLVLMSGDFISPDLIKEFNTSNDTCELISLGGATEGSIWSIYYPITKANGEKIPYGYPLFNQNILILDDKLNECPDYVVGDIYIKGEGVAQGYMGDELKTKEQFIKQDGEIIYKTGDLGYFDAKGYVQIAGRIDNQVKIQGFRVELGEIEQTLLENKAINDAVVLAKDSGNAKVLVAFICTTHDIQTKDIQNYLREYLPEYMIPSSILTLDNIPLTPNGKVDKKSLDKIKIDIGSLREYVAPSDDIEKTLVSLFEQMLSCAKVGIHDNFFELGGHSLLAIRLLSAINAEFNSSFSIAILFQAPSVSELKKMILSDDDKLHVAVTVQPNGDEPTIFAVPGNGGSSIVFQPLSKALGSNQPFYALESVGTDGKTEFLNSIEEIAQVNIKAMKEVQPKGPYKLIGYSFGATVVFEMLHHLKGEVESVVFIDSFSPHMKFSFREIMYEKIKSFSYKIPGMSELARIRRKLRGLEIYNPTEQDIILNKVQKNNSKCYELYKPKFLDTDYNIALFKIDKFREDYDYGWSMSIKTDIYKYKINGNHNNVIKAENAEALAMVFKQYYSDIKNKKDNN